MLHTLVNDHDTLSVHVSTVIRGRRPHLTAFHQQNPCSCPPPPWLDDLLGGSLLCLSRRPFEVFLIHISVSSASTIVSPKASVPWSYMRIKSDTMFVMKLSTDVSTVWVISISLKGLPAFDA